MPCTGLAFGTVWSGLLTNEAKPDKGQNRTMPDFVRSPVPDRHGHPPIGVSVCPEDRRLFLGFVVDYVSCDRTRADRAACPLSFGDALVRCL
jgi:hypothetical protein